MLAWCFQSIKRSYKQIALLSSIPVLVYLYFCVLPLQLISGGSNAVVGLGSSLIAGIDCPNCLLYWLRLHGEDKIMQPGNYKITKYTTYNSLRHNIVNGVGDVAYLVIPEGSTTDQVMADIAKNPNIVKTGSLLNYKGKFAFLPTTLRFPPGISDKQLLEMAASYHDRVIKNIEKNCQRKYSKIFEIVASIIQKESANEVEYPFISAVIYNRLNNNMKLQVDVVPDSYKVLGLPSKPISAPSIAALKAACSPDTSGWWLYYAAVNGKHVFSSNYQDHLQIVERSRHVRKY